ncbi:hypothetical protein G6F64_014769 [Rhizopus arrhizus]|uniref:AMP-dependent synthetase/ligase domain-containing protein n=1 Tax=Rhizopus oryzae TaxID=64495 RepID=A0A9P6WSU2_RHIOR|nr:hypothetical protein G6F64_014769 [Rhizopus arrhizus]
MSRVRVAYTAGAAIGPDLFVFYRSIGINLKQLYGSTETSVFVCVQPDGHVRDDTVGPPVAGVEIRVADNGEILVKSPGLLKVYYRNPGAAAAARRAAFLAAAGMRRPLQPVQLIQLQDLFLEAARRQEQGRQPHGL